MKNNIVYPHAVYNKEHNNYDYPKYWERKAYEPKPLIPQRPIRTNQPVNKLLEFILQTKRPTKDPAFCTRFTSILLDRLKIDHNTDKYGNLIVEVGDGTATTCFTSHTDTVHSDHGRNELVQEAGYLKVKGGGVLGADDGTGMYIMMQMIRSNVPGHYVFFAEEEKGRIGSSKYYMPEHIMRCVSFDRKGIDNLITMQSGEEGCSDEFATAFISKFPIPFRKDPTGSFTDSYTFFDTVPECINLSVGYYSQHTKDEVQDVWFAERMVQACCDMDWESLPTVRDPVPDIIDQGYTGPITDLYDFCFDHPEIVSLMLDEYGVTLSDCIKYKRLSETDKPYDYRDYYKNTK